MYSSNLNHAFPIRIIAVALPFLLAGCFASHQTQSVQDMPVQPVADEYYNVTPKDETYLMHAINYTAAGAAGDPSFGFHTFAELEEKLLAWSEPYPELVALSVVGESIGGYPVARARQQKKPTPP